MSNSNDCPYVQYYGRFVYEAVQHKTIVSTKLQKQRQKKISYMQYELLTVILYMYLIILSFISWMCSMLIFVGFLRPCLRKTVTHMWISFLIFS